MANETSLYERVMRALYDKAITVDSNVYMSSRPTAVDKKDTFIVVRLSQGIDPYADTHDTAYVQFHCYVRDRQGGIENVQQMGTLIDAVRALIPFSDELIVCNQDKPFQLPSKSDGMGFHSTVIQFKILIKE